MKHGDLPVQDRPNETLDGVPTAPTDRDHVNCAPLMTLLVSSMKRNTRIDAFRIAWRGV